MSPLSIFEPYIVMGGSFDPVHIGHLWMAQQVWHHFVDQSSRIAASTQGQHTIKPSLCFMPTPLNPLKKTKTSVKHRLAMLKLSLRDTPFSISHIELNGSIPASSINTFTALRQQLGEQRPIVFIVGQDSIDTLHTWQGGYDLLGLVHFWVFPRVDSPHFIPNEIAHAVTASTESLYTQPCGSLYYAPNTPPSVSSTQIRQNPSRRPALVHPRVLAYSSKAKLYTNE